MADQIVGSDAGQIDHQRENNRDWLKALQQRIDIDGRADDIAADDLLGMLMCQQIANSSVKSAAETTLPLLIAKWVAPMRSRTLHISGPPPTWETEGEMSAASYLCTQVVEAMYLQGGRAEFKDHLFALRWFAGFHEHTNSDSNAHPEEMLRQLLAQFIGQLVEAQEPPRIHNFPVHHVTFRLRELCDLFVQLVEALNDHATVWCVIDGISVYEYDFRRKDCMKILRMLNALAHNDSLTARGCIFSLLVTTPKRSRIMQELLRPDEILEIEAQPNFMEADDRMDKFW